MKELVLQKLKTIKERIELSKQKHLSAIDNQIKKLPGAKEIVSRMKRGEITKAQAKAMMDEDKAAKREMSITADFTRVSRAFDNLGVFVGSGSIGLDDAALELVMRGLHDALTSMLQDLDFDNVGEVRDRINALLKLQDKDRIFPAMPALELSYVPSANGNKVTEVATTEAAVKSEMGMPPP